MRRASRGVRAACARVDGGQNSIPSPWPTTDLAAVTWPFVNGEKHPVGRAAPVPLEGLGDESVEV